VAFPFVFVQYPASPFTIMPHLSHLNRLAGVSSVARYHIY